MSTKIAVGTDAQFILTPLSGGADVVLKNSDWDIEGDPSLAMASNTVDGITRCAGLFDYSGNVKGTTDVTSVSTAAEGQAKMGDIFNFKAYKSKNASTCFAGSLILGKLKISTGTTTAENWSFEFFKQSGALTFPDLTTR